jgi:hypothetical protein
VNDGGDGFVAGGQADEGKTADVGAEELLEEVASCSKG